MQTLPTWGGRTHFQYEGSVPNGTVIYYGRGRNGEGWRVRVSAHQYEALRHHFLGQVVPVGTSHTDPPPGSLGAWLQENVTRVGIASYVAPILVHEGYAERVGRHYMCITR